MTLRSALSVEPGEEVRGRQPNRGVSNHAAEHDDQRNHDGPDDPSRMRTAARAPVIDHAGYDQQLGDEARHESDREGWWWPQAWSQTRPATGENHEEDAPHGRLQQRERSENHEALVYVRPLYFDDGGGDETGKQPDGAHR